MASIRVCYIQMAGILDESNGRMTGTGGDAANLALDALRGMNLTFVPELTSSSIVDSKTGLCDGCIGSMQRNLSDVSLEAAYMPIVDDNIDITGVTSVDKDTLLSFYDNSFVGKATDVLDFVGSFPPALWLIFSAFILLLGCMLFARGVIHEHSRWITRRQKSKRLLSVREIRKLLTGCLLRQMGSFTVARNVRGASFITMLLVMLVYYSSFYLTSMIKTEAVVFRDPFVINTYTDLLESGLRPIWAPALEGERFFPLPSPLEQQVYEQIEKMGIEKSRMRDLDQVYGHIPAVVGGDEVILTFGNHARHLAMVLCFHLRSKAIHPNQNAWVKSDPTAVEKIWIAVVRRHYVRESTVRLIQKRSHWIYESSLVTYVGQQNVVTILPLYQEQQRLSTANIHSQLQQCLLNRIMFPDHDLAPLSLNHYRPLFRMLAAVLTVITIMHLLQVMHRLLAQYWMSQMS